MTTEAVDLVLYSFLKTQHDEERNDGSRQPNTYAGDCDLVDSRGKSLLLLTAYSLGYEI